MFENQTQNKLFKIMLEAAKDYYYYVEGTFGTTLTDATYDELTRYLANNHDKITDIRKNYIDWEALKTCSSLSYLKEEWYGQQRKTKS